MSAAGPSAPPPSTPLTQPAGRSIYQPFSWPVRVYWEDTDAGGVVYHARYVYFLERARSEWLRSFGVEQRALREREDAVFAVRSVTMQFRSPARLDDLLDVRCTLRHVGGASLRFEQSVHRADGELLLSAEVGAACLSGSSFRPRPIPGWLAELAGEGERQR